MFKTKEAFRHYLYFFLFLLSNICNHSSTLKYAVRTWLHTFLWVAVTLCLLCLAPGHMLFTQCALFCHMPMCQSCLYLKPIAMEREGDWRGCLYRTPILCLVGKYTKVSFAWILDNEEFQINKFLYLQESKLKCLLSFMWSIINFPIFFRRTHLM